MKNKNSEKEILSGFTKNFLNTFVENHVPVWGDILAASNQTISDIEISDRFEPLERKLRNINEEDLEKLKNLPVDDSLLIKDDLEKLINLYLKAAYKKRREYLANAILNVATLKNKDYQQNSFFNTILTFIPDISIELLGLYRKYSKSGKIEKSESLSKDFEELKKKYSTQLSEQDILQNNITNGLIKEKITNLDFNNFYEPKETEYYISDAGNSLLNYISNDVKEK